MAIAFIGLGSNLGDRRSNLERAVSNLKASINVLARSSLYETEPIGRLDQPPFLNAVAKIQTSLSPKKLLALLLSVEEGLGRIRAVHWGPRTIDLDLLLYDDLIVQSPDLTLPHPEMTKRAFVLIPLSEVEPDLRLSGGKTPAEHLSTLAPPWGVNLIGGWKQ